MKFLKKFERFNEEFVAPEVEDNDTKTKPATPITKPGTRPGRPSPIRRDKPSVDPRPKAEVEDVAKRFIKLMKSKGEDIKKYVDDK